MIQIDAVWLAVEPIDMRAGTERLLASVVQVFGAAQAHHGYLFYVEQLASNLMMHLLVENADHWHEHLAAQGIVEQFGVKLGAPEERPWAMRDFTLHDPSGVLWRIGHNIVRNPAQPT